MPHYKYNCDVKSGEMFALLLCVLHTILLLALEANAKHGDQNPRYRRLSAQRAIPVDEKIPSIALYIACPYSLMIAAVGINSIPPTTT